MHSINTYHNIWLHYSYHNINCIASTMNYYLSNNLNSIRYIFALNCNFSIRWDMLYKYFHLNNIPFSIHRMKSYYCIFSNLMKDRMRRMFIYLKNKYPCIQSKFQSRIFYKTKLCKLCKSRL